MPYYFKDGVTGGAERQAYLLAHALVRRGYDVAYICGHVDGKPAVEDDHGVEIKRVLRWTGKLQFLDYIRIIDQLRRGRADVVITRIRFYYFPLALYSLLTSKMFLAFVSEDDLTLPLPEVRKLLRRGCRRRVWMCPLYLLHAFVVDVLASLGLILSSRVLVQNEVQRSNLRRFFLKGSQIFPQIFLPFSMKVKKSKTPTLIWIANARPVKRPELFVELAKLLPDYRFVMVGRNTERFASSSPNLTVLGELSHREAMEWLGRAWILVNTSLWEGFSNTFLEAWFLRTLVLTFGVDPKVGLKVSTLQEAKEKILEVVRNKTILRQITERAYTYLLENHDEDEVVTRLLNLVVGE
ncbi:MAG: glycosyltransferase family 4 protein [Thermotogae bacterium]|nr:glycosyltransferase family 4 protein [Thermotogota bacterium]